MTKFKFQGFLKENGLKLSLTGVQMAVAGPWRVVAGPWRFMEAMADLEVAKNLSF